MSIDFTNPIGELWRGSKLTKSTDAVAPNKKYDFFILSNSRGHLVANIIFCKNKKKPYGLLIESVDDIVNLG